MFLSLINYIPMKDKFIIWLCGLISAARKKSVTDWNQIKALLREDVASHKPLLAARKAENCQVMQSWLEEVAIHVFCWMKQDKVLQTQPSFFSSAPTPEWGEPSLWKRWDAALHAAHSNRAVLPAAFVLSVGSCERRKGPKQPRLEAHPSLLCLQASSYTHLQGNELTYCCLVASLDRRSSTSAGRGVRLKIWIHAATGTGYWKLGSRNGSRSGCSASLRYVMLSFT